MDSMDLLRYMAPVAVLLLVPATLAMERDAFGVVADLARVDPSFLWILLCNSCLAYFVNLTNFLVTKHTSALTLQVNFFIIQAHRMLRWLHCKPMLPTSSCSSSSCCCHLCHCVVLMPSSFAPLSLQVLGNAKGAVAVVVSILIFRNPVTVVGMLGYGVTVAGVVLYGEAKKRSK